MSDPGVSAPPPMPPSPTPGSTLTPIGGDSNLDIIAGMQALVGQQTAAIQQAKDIAKEMTSLAERTSRYLETGTKRIESSIRAMDQMPVAAGLPTAAGPTRPKIASGTVSVDDLMAGPPVAGPAVNQPKPPPGIFQGVIPDGSNGTSAWQQGKSLSVADVRTKISRNVTERISGWNPGHIAPTAVDAQGNPTAYGWVDKAGQVTGENAEGPALQRALAKNAVASRLKTGISAMGKGAGLEGGVEAAIPMLGKAAGVAGAVFAGTNFALDKAQDQREQNLQYQRALGGTNFEGFGERVGENLAGWGGKFNTMGSDNARKLYAGAAEAFGNRRGDRQAAMQFGTTAYMELGLDVETSLGLIRAEARKGKSDFQQLATSLREVTKAARDSGASVKDTQEYFVGLRDALEKAGFTGRAGTGLATSITSAQAAAGPELSGDHFDLSGALTDQTFLTEVGGSEAIRQAFGKPLTEDQVRSNFNLLGPGSKEGGAMYDALYQVIKRKAAAFMPQGFDAAQAQWQQYRDQGVGETDAVELLSQSGAVNLQMLQAYAAQLGWKMDRIGATKFLAQMFSGEWKNSLDKSRAGQGTPAALQPMAGADLGAVAKDLGASDDESKKWSEIQRLAQTDPAKAKAMLESGDAPSRDNLALQKYLGGKVGLWSSGGTSWSQMDKPDQFREGNLEWLLRSQKDHPDLKFKVKDAQGKEQEVSSWDLYNRYNDQAMSGAAKVVGGGAEFDGKTIGELSSSNASKLAQDYIQIKVDMPDDVKRNLSVEAKWQSRGQASPGSTNPDSGKP